MTENIHEMTQQLFCLPCDTGRTREALPLSLSFEYVVGSRTNVPTHHSTQWRTMPFHLCCLRENPCRGASSLVEMDGHTPFEAQARDLLFIPAGRRHCITDLPEAGPAVSLWMHFRFRAMMVFDAFQCYDVPTRIPYPQSTPLIDLMSRLVALPHQLDFAESLEQQRLGTQFCAELIAFGKPRELPGFSFDFHMRQILPLLQYLDTAVRCPPLKEMAGSVHLSVSRFQAVFRQVTRTSPVQYFEQARCRHACLLLMRRELSVRDIAEQLGYCSPYHFSARFRQFAGVSPRQFRQSNGHSPMERMAASAAAAPEDMPLPFHKGTLR